MAARPPIQIRYAPSRVYDVHQGTYPGAQTVVGRRGWWAAPDEPNANLARESMCRHGGHLVISGTFTTVGGVAHAKLAVIQIETGDVTSQAHTFTGSGATLAAVESDGTYLYVGGDFASVDGETTIAGRAVAGLVRFDYNGVLDTTWNPSPNAAATAVQLLRYNPANGTLYVAGSGLTTLNGTARVRIGEVSLGDAGNATAWIADPDGAVTAVTVDEAGARVYLGGDFANAFGAAHVRLLRATMTGAGAADAWAPAPNGNVADILVYGGLVYCVGAFTAIGSGATARNRAGTVNPDATAGPWDPNLNGTGQSLALYRDMIFVAGDFTQVGGATTRNRLALFGTAGAGTLQAWNPNADGNVRKVVLYDRTLYVAGAFANVNGAAHANLAAVPFPIFTDTNTKYVAKTGSDAAAGTAAAPYLTVSFALSQLAGAFTYVVIQDSGQYDEAPSITYAANEAGGLFAADGQAPTLGLPRGAIPDTYGARATGREKFSTGGAGTFIYVSKLGDNATGVRGDSSKPFLTITGALGAAGRAANDTIQIQDDGIYKEDLTIGALSITIQAADGKVPTLVASAAGVIHITATGGGAVRLYGLAIVDPPDVSVGAAFGVFTTAANMELYDCTISGSSAGAASTGGGTILVVNCHFVRCGTVGLGVTGTSATAMTVTIENCSFDECPTAKPTTVQSALVIGGGAVGATFTVQRCTVTGGFGAAHLLAQSARNLTVVGCLFQDSPDSTTAGVILNTPGGAGVAHGAWVVRNCLMRNLGGSAFQDTTKTGDTVTSRLYESLVADGCGVFTETDSFYLASIVVANGVTLRNCVALDSSRHGFSFGYQGGAAGTIIVDRCVSINAGSGPSGIGSGFQVTRAAQITLTMTACIEDGSSVTGSSGSIQVTNATGSMTVSHTIVATRTTGSFTAGVGFVQTDPVLVSTVAGEENVALRASSPCVLRNVDRGNLGIASPIVDVVSATFPFDVDGLIVDGELNFFDGLRVAFALTVRITAGWCTFRSGAVQGATLASGAFAERCLFDTNHGFGVVLADSGCQAYRVVAQNNVGAGIVAAAVVDVVNCTAFGNDYGQFDVVTAIGREARNNVLAVNSTLDYDGDGTHLSSDVARISDEATIDGSRRDPLYRDVTAPDLRLQTIEVGYRYDSPAKGLADDGGDAGAFVFYYGPVTLTWSTADFGTSGWRNPGHVERQPRPLKLTEVDTWGGNIESVARAVKTVHVLTWDGDTDMPEAQRAAVVAIYENLLGEVQVTFDGGSTWTPCRVLKSADLRYTEIEGLPYSDDEVPRPTNQLLLQESA